MPMALLLVALVLVICGLGSFLMGLSLMPTDISRAWLVVGATLFTGGMISLAIGFAVQSLAGALARAGGSAAPEPAAASAQAASAPVEPHFETSDSAAIGAGHSGLIAAGGVILGAGAGVLAATAAERDNPAAASPATVPPADEFERDLFSLYPETAPVEPVDAVLPELPSLDLRLSPGFSDPETSKGAVVEQQSEPLPEVLLAPEVLAAPEVLLAPKVLAAPEVAEVQPQQQPASPQAVAGLIADDDLAALQAEETPLAPLEQLEIVGAYDSGGVRFTMYSDGSVHAAGPEGEQRYRSLEALRKRLDAGLSAV